MPSPESSRWNLEYARRIGRVKFWRSRAESQRAKAEIVQAYYTVPRPSQRAIAARLHCSQPYVRKIFGKIERLGPEKAVGPEAYEQYKALRDAELSKRHQSLVSEWERSIGAATTSPKEAHSHDNSGSNADVQGKPEQREGPIEYVELARDTNGNVFEIPGSRPYPPPPPPQQPPQTPDWVKRAWASNATVVPYRIWTPERERVDDLLRMWAGINPSRSRGWFPVGF